MFIVCFPLISMGPLHFVRKGMLVFCIWERPHSFSCFYLPALFDTTSRALGGGLELRWRASRASHPSEDLSEPPPLLVSVAGREYHCVLTESLRNSLPRLFSSGWGPLGTLFGRLLYGLCPHRWSWRIRLIAFPFSGGSVRERIPVAGYDRETRCFSKCRKRKQFVLSLYNWAWQVSKRNTSQKLFYKILKLTLIFADHLWGNPIFSGEDLRTGSLFSVQIQPQQICRPGSPCRQGFFQFLHQHRITDLRFKLRLIWELLQAGHGTIHTGKRCIQGRYMKVLPWPAPGFVWPRNALYPIGYTRWRRPRLPCSPCHSHQLYSRG